MPEAISVALCTYNGEAHLAEQLASIATQDRLPDELIVCDDVSTDDTAAIVSRFANSLGFPLRFFQNESNVGPAQNFAGAIARCTGDIIVLSDQDDVWMPNKLSATVDAFASDSKLALVFTDGENVDENLTPLGTTLSDSGRMDATVRRALDGSGAFAYLLRRNVATGATMAFRASYRNLILPIPTSIAGYHDAWIVQLISAIGKIAFIPEPLIQYRRHGGQQTWDFVTTGRVAVGDNHYAAHLRQLRALQERLGGRPEATGSIAIVADYIAHLNVRSALGRGAGRVANVAREVSTGRYHRYSSGLRSAARDLLSG